VVYREVHDNDGPTRLGFAAYWRGSNVNPTLTPFVTMLRERFPDLIAAQEKAPGQQPGFPAREPKKEAS
jgi:hypothetical protein